MSDHSYIASCRTLGRISLILLLALSCLLLGFDGAEVSETRDNVLDEDYQTELPQFTDAELENPLDFLNEQGEDSKKCDPSEDADCESPGEGERAGHGDDKAGESGEGESGRSEGDDGSEDSAASEKKSFWDHEAKFEPPEEPEPPDIDIPEGLLTVLQVLGITVLVVIVLLIVWRIVLAFSNRSETAEHVEDTGAAESGGALRSNAPTKPHAELADHDQYDEAIHRLLLEVIDVLSERQSGLSSPSLTSRELLRRVRIDDESHRHLTALVRTVEEILFARRSADAEKYQTSLDHFREIMRALGRGSV